MRRTNILGTLLFLLAAACAPQGRPQDTTTIGTPTSATATTVGTSTTEAAPGQALTFIPETTTDGTAAMVEVTFPNGATGELVYPAELELASGGIHPLISVWERPDILEFGPQRQLWALHGQAEEVVRTLNEGNEAEVLATYERARRYDMDDQVWPDRDFLAWQLGSWTVLADDFHPEAEDQTAFTEEERSRWAGSLSGRETENGFLVVEVSPPLEILAGDDLLVGGPELTAADLIRRTRFFFEMPEGLLVSASGCVPEAEPADPEDPREESRCLEDTQVRLSVKGPESFVKRVSAQVDMASVDLPEHIVDPAWVSSEEMEAHNDGHDHVWLAGVFFPASADPFSGDSETVLRWRITDDLDPEAPSEEVVGAAFAALSGGAPPGLIHPLRGIPLQLREVAVSDRTVTLDFERSFLATTFTGSAGGFAYATQVQAMVAHYYPRAVHLEILVEGECRSVFHDALFCDPPVDI